MCNPNSSVANRRFRLAQFQAGGKTNLLTQKLVGSLMAVPPTLGSNKDNNIRTSRISSSSIDRSDYSIVTKSREGDGDTFNVDYPASYEGVYNERSTSFSFPTSPPIAGYLSGSASSHFFQQPEFEESAPLPVTTTPNNVRKQKERRRRKPQQPGLTAKNQERHFVQHNYHDHALDEEEEESSDESQQHRRRGGVSVSFPLKLHSVLEQVELDGFANVISWQPHGRCFCIHKPKEFTDVVMPRYFRQTKLTSFQRQLNLYGFQRLTRGNDSGGYYHELFLRYKAFLCKRMIRTKVKGTKFKAASSPEHEPNFYHMPPVVVTPHSSDCDHSENDDCSSGHDSHSKGSSEPITIENQPFQQPLLYHYNHAPHPNYAMVQPHDPPKSTMVNKLALKIFGSDLLEMPPSPQVSAQVSVGSPIMANVSRGYVAAPVISTAPSISLAPSNEFLDQAIDDLFLENPQAANEVMDFVTAWDEEFDKGQVTNDLELGNLLDKILED